MKRCLRFCIANELPGGVSAACPRLHFEWETLNKDALAKEKHSAICVQSGLMGNSPRGAELTLNLQVELA